MAGHAVRLVSLIAGNPDLELLAPAPLNIVCFRFVTDGASDDELNAINEELLLRVQESGVAVPSGTTLHGRFAIRVGNQHPQETSAALARRGIFTWDGHYYAIEVFDRLGLLDTGGAVRIGFCHYHTADEVDRFVAMVRG